MDLAALLFIINRIIAGIGVIIILWGAIFALYCFIFRWKKRKNADMVRLEFGRTIILGIEFIVAADVIETITAPDYYSLGILASLVVIRTFLTYFMDRELNKLTALEKKKI